jgi:hypothetical protein
VIPVKTQFCFTVVRVLVPCKGVPETELYPQEAYVHKEARCTQHTHHADSNKFPGKHRRRRESFQLGGESGKDSWERKQWSKA